MSQSLNGGGSGGGQGAVVAGLAPKKPTAEPAPAPANEAARNQVSFQTADGTVLSGRLLRVTRHAVVFELLNPSATPKLSETFDFFKITLQAAAVYSGRAVIRSVVDDGITVTCEATLTEVSWMDAALGSGLATAEKIHGDFQNLMRDWQKSQLVSRDYKVAVIDQQTFLGDLRLWLERVELQIRAAPPATQSRLQSEIEQRLREPVISALHNLFEKFEVISDQIPPDQETAHHAFARRQLHSFWLAAPFMHRTFAKPLGYAGDYEMMNMIVRNGMEGESLFARLINSYLLDQPPCRAVRNRVGFLETKIIAETGRIARTGRRAKIFGIACGPAWEATNIIAQHPLADHAEFYLLDFNEETLRHTEAKMAAVKKQSRRQTPVKFIKNSVQNLLRARGRASNVPEYDLIYCSGLYDYLSDSVCRALNSHLYELLKPGGLLVVGNFAANTPGQNLMEHLMEWFLIYRTGRQLATLGPEQAAPDDCVVRAEPTGANIFLEVRKPE